MAPFRSALQSQKSQDNRLFCGILSAVLSCGEYWKQLGNMHKKSSFYLFSQLQVSREWCSLCIFPQIQSACLGIVKERNAFTLHFWTMYSEKTRMDLERCGKLSSLLPDWGIRPHLQVFSLFVLLSYICRRISSRPSGDKFLPSVVKSLLPVTLRSKFF